MTTYREHKALSLNRETGFFADAKVAVDILVTAKTQTTTTYAY